VRRGEVHSDRRAQELHLRLRPLKIGERAYKQKTERERNREQGPSSLASLGRTARKHKHGVPLREAGTL